MLRTEILINKGYAAIEEGNYQSAVAQFEKATTISPSNSELYAYLGEAYFLNKEYEKARKALDKRDEIVLGEDQLTPYVIGYRGAILLAQGEVDKAQPLLEKAIAAQVHDPQIYYDFAMLKLIKKEFLEANKLLKKIEAYDPTFYYRKIRELTRTITTNNPDCC